MTKHYGRAGGWSSAVGVIPLLLRTKEARALKQCSSALDDEVDRRSERNDLGKEANDLGRNPHAAV